MVIKKERNAFTASTVHSPPAPRRQQAALKPDPLKVTRRAMAVQVDKFADTPSTSTDIRPLAYQELYKRDFRQAPGSIVNIPITGKALGGEKGTTLKIKEQEQRVAATEARIANLEHQLAETNNAMRSAQGTARERYQDQRSGIQANLNSQRRLLEIEQAGLNTLRYR